MEKFSENFNSYKIFLKDIKNIITKIRNKLEEINCRLDNTKKNNTNYQPERQNYGNQSEQQKGKGIFKNEERLRDIWDNIKHTDIHVIGFSEREKRREIKIIGKK